MAQCGSRSVVVQNFSGELKAFLNVCTHRFSAIRRDCKGNGPLQCQYHGWVFDASGAPSGIANVRDFAEITDGRREELRLERWDVEQCGELLFIRHPGSEGPGLRAFLGIAWERTEAIGTRLGEQIDFNRMTVDANWKVTVENTLENYHVRSVHPETFARLAAKTSAFEYHDSHSAWTADIEPQMQKKLGRLTRALGLAPYFEGYVHQLIFPALTLATTAGMTYAIQTFRPLSAHSTEFTSYVFAARHEGSDAQRQLLLEACRPAVDFNRSVFEEDRIICGEAQRGIAQANRGMIGELSTEEQRVAHFQLAWKERMSGGI